MKKSGKKYGKNDIYHLKNWTMGYTNFTKIENNEAVSNYVKKYITKDMLNFPNKKRYWVSKDLTKPARENNIDIFKYGIEKGELLHETELYFMYKTPKG